MLFFLVALLTVAPQSFRQGAGDGFLFNHGVGRAEERVGRVIQGVAPLSFPKGTVAEPGNLAASESTLFSPVIRYTMPSPHRVSRFGTSAPP